MKASLLTMAGLILIVASAAPAADTNEMRGQFSRADYRFATAATKGGMTEVSLSQVALTKAADPAVKIFAQRMVTDHTQANDKLAKIVAAKGAIISTELPKGATHEMTALQNLSGADFDKGYMDRMVKDHKSTVKAFEHESASGQDADLKAFATATLPTIQDHLKMAEDLDARINGSAKP